MDNSPHKSEQLRVLLFLGDGDAKGASGKYSPLFDEIERQGIHEITVLTETDEAAVGSALSTSKNTLCIATDYSFRNREIADIFARTIDNGLRLLVLDASLENKTLAERLNITNIKHKVRIEKMEFGNWNTNKNRLLSVILGDELQRLKTFG